MAGFMSGFGQAFSRSYENARDRRHQSEERAKERKFQEDQDAFRMYYSSFLENQKAMREYEREDAKKVRNAETVAQLTGYDPRVVYNLLDAYTPDQIQQMYENGAEIESIVDPTKAQEKPANVNAGTDPQEPAAVQQTQSMLSQDQNPFTNDPRTQQFNEKIASVSGVPVDKISETMTFDPSKRKASGDGLQVKWKLPKKTKEDKGPTSRAEIARARAIALRDGDQDMVALLDSQLAELNKIDPQDQERMIDSINELVSVLNDPNLTDDERARYQAQLDQLRTIDQENRAADIKTSLTLKGEINPEGSGLAIVQTPEGVKRVPIDQVQPGMKARPESQAEINEQNEIFKETKDQAQDFQKRATKYKQAEHIVKNITDIVKSDPNVATAGGAISATADNLVKNAAGIINSVDQMIADVQNGGDYMGGAEALSEAEAKIRSLVQQGSPTNQRALNYALLEINKRRLAYIQAASMGSQGTSLSQKEYEGFLDGLNRGGGQGLVQNINTWLKGERQVLQSEADAINNTARARRYKETFGIEPPPVVIIDPDTPQGQFTEEPPQNRPAMPITKEQLPPELQDWTIAPEVDAQGRMILISPDGKQRKVLKRRQ